MSDASGVQQSDLAMAAGDSSNIKSASDALELSQYMRDVNSNISAVGNGAAAFASAQTAITKLKTTLDADAACIISVANALDSVDNRLADEVKKQFQ